MTTFAIVQRQISLRQTGNSKSAKTPVNNSLEEDCKKTFDVRHYQRSRKNKTATINGNYNKTRYTAQIGLIYLKPLVHFSTTVYFHSKSDFTEELRSTTKDSRYGFVIIFSSKFANTGMYLCLSCS